MTTRLNDRVANIMIMLQLGSDGKLYCDNPSFIEDLDKKYEYLS